MFKDRMMLITQKVNIVCPFSNDFFSSWEIDNNYCKTKVIKTPPYDSGPRLLDIMDTAMFDFLIG